jgi:hypothetical protein
LLRATTSASGVVARAPGSTPATALREQPDSLDAHAAIRGLEHVVDGQQGHGHSGQGFHLDAGAIAHARGCGCADAGQIGIRLEVDVDVRERERMAERNQLARTLGRLDARYSRDHERITLRRFASDDQAQCRGIHQDYACRGRNPLGDVLVAHVDHHGTAGLIEVRETASLVLLRSSHRVAACGWSRAAILWMTLRSASWGLMFSSVR